MPNLRESKEVEPEIEEGYLIRFAYTPPIGKDRDYTLIVKRVEDERIEGEVTKVHPPTIFGLQNRCFSRNRMTILSVFVGDYQRNEFSNRFDLEPLVLD